MVEESSFAKIVTLTYRLRRVKRSSPSVGWLVCVSSNNMTVYCLQNVLLSSKLA